MTRAEGLSLQEDPKVFTVIAEEEGEWCEAGDTRCSLRMVVRKAKR